MIMTSYCSVSDKEFMRGLKITRFLISSFRRLCLAKFFLTTLISNGKVAHNHISIVHECYENNISIN